MNVWRNNYSLWLTLVDEEIENITSGEITTANDLPDEVERYDLWLSGDSPTKAAKYILKCAGYYDFAF